MTVLHGKNARVHFVAGHINSIPIPCCGDFIGGAAVRHTKRFEFVSCPGCRRVLVACGLQILERYRAPDVEDPNGDVVTYSLPAFAKARMSE